MHLGKFRKGSSMTARKDGAVPAGTDGRLGQHQTESWTAEDPQGSSL